MQDLKNWKVQNEITTAPVWGGSRELLVHDVIDTEGGFYMTSLPTFYFINEDMRIISMLEGVISEPLPDQIYLDSDRNPTSTNIYLSIILVYYSVIIV